MNSTILFGNNNPLSTWSKGREMGNKKHKVRAVVRILLLTLIYRREVRHGTIGPSCWIWLIVLQKLFESLRTLGYSFGHYSLVLFWVILGGFSKRKNAACFCRHLLIKTNPSLIFIEVSCRDFVSCLINNKNTFLTRWRIWQTGTQRLKSRKLPPPPPSEVIKHSVWK